jgi:GAF domain-containing protein
MHQIVPADYVSVVIRDRHSADIVSIYSRDQAHLGRVDIERCHCTGELRELLPHPDGIWRDRKAAAAAYFGPVVRLGAESMCAFPIVWSKEVVGVIVLGFAKTLVLDVDTSTRARNLGDRLGVAFATAAKDEQLYYQANYDTLTGLPNRHHFKDRLAQVLVQAHRERSQFALLFIDLDQFKDVNDSLGHAAGDEALRQTAERLKRCTRESDLDREVGWR